MRWSCAIVVTTALACGCPTRGVAEIETVYFTWRSTPSDATAQTREVTRFYLALYNSGNLKTRTVDNINGTFVEPLALREGVLIGNGLSPDLDAMFCDLNPRICSRELLPASNFGDITGHVGGYQVTPTNWRFGAGTKIRLPDYEFDTYEQIVAQAVPEGWSPKDFVSSSDLGCTDWGLTCSELVRKLNPEILGGSKSSMAALPVTGFSTEFTIRYDAHSHFLEALEARGINLTPVDDLALGWSTDYTIYALSQRMTDLVLSALSDNVILVGNVQKYGFRDEALFSEQVNVFKLVDHPFALGKDLEEQFRNPIPILVLDGAFQGGHCDLNLVGVDNDDENCDLTEVALPSPIDNHALHIIGVINAPLNEKGIVGMDPYASVSFKAINMHFANDTDLREAETQLMLGTIIDDARVTNLSWGFNILQDKQNAFANAIAAIEKRTLVVVAAGNEGHDLSGVCIVLPACLTDAPNVITVVGLDTSEDDPQLWREGGQGSNSSPNFHIGAIAKDVFSTIGNSKFGRMSGTSQAVPQVTAAAALVFSAAQEIYPELANGTKALPPKVVKDRLTYTADQFSDLQPLVLGGRLNIERAIDIVNTQLVLKRIAQDGSGQDSDLIVEGNLQKFPDGNLVICLNSDGTETQYNFSTIRRLSYNSLRDAYTIFRNDAPLGDSANRVNYRLERIVDCNMKTRNNEALLVTADGTEVSFKLGEVLDYTSPMIR